MRRRRESRADAGPVQVVTTAGTADDRFELGGYYLARPHPDRGGVVYACRYDARARCVRRRSLETADWEAAKVALAALVLSAPASTEGQIPGPHQVMTIAALKNYLDGHATTIRTEADAARAVDLCQEYLEKHVKNSMAPVSFWTPSRQLDFAGWLHRNFKHSPASIERRLDVICAAFHEMTEVKMRLDPFGQPVETALMTHAPKFVYKRARIARELKIAPSKPRHSRHTIEDVAKLLDSLEAEHQFRFAILSLNTLARPEAVHDFDPATQRAHGLIDLNPPGRVETNKRRALIPETRCLAGWLDRWAKEDAGARAEAVAKGYEPPPEALLVFQGERVKDGKKGLRSLAGRIGIGVFSPGRFRHFMTTTLRRECRGVTREQRSLWLGHVVREGSRTTDNYEAHDPEYLADVALAIDHVMLQLQAHCKRPLFAGSPPKLDRQALAHIGARPRATRPKLSATHNESPRVAG